MRFRDLRFRPDRGQGERAPRRRVLDEPRDEMRMQVGQRVAQGLVIELQRLVHPEQGTRYLQRLGPVPRRLYLAKLGRLSDVEAAGYWAETLKESRALLR